MAVLLKKREREREREIVDSPEIDEAWSNRRRI